MRGLLRGRAFSSRRCFLGLDARHVLQAASLEALIVIQTAARGPGIASQLGQALLRGVAVIGVAHEAHGTGLMDHAEVVARVTRLLATVVFLLRFGSGRAVERTCGAILPNRGGIRRPSRGSRTARHTLRRCGPEAVLGRLRPDATRDAARESMGVPVIDASQRAVLAPLASDAVSRSSASRAVCPRVWAGDRWHRYDRGDSCGVAHHSCRHACGSQTPARHGVIRRDRRRP